MPKLDGTGPIGQGPRTGRGMGNCSGVGQGWGRGFGRFFFGCPFWNGKQITKEERRKILLEEKELIEQELSNLESDK